MNPKLEIKERTTVDLSIYGQELKVLKPNFRAVSDMQNKLEASEGGGNATLDIFSSFLVSAGIPKELIDEMEVDHLTDVVRILCEAKKK